jgi:oxygen-independent coproporphyrinogen-3 oxidase
MSGVRHLYVHVPFCAHRCGYCDFVTAVGRRREHGAYVEALLAELELEREHLAPALETVFLGGGTPTFLETGVLGRLLAGLPAAEEVTIEANPETVTPPLARTLRDAGVTRVSLGVQSFSPRLLALLERRAGPDAVRRAFYDLRDANIDNISLDLIYGIPGQTAADVARDLEQAIGLRPEHLSCYELEAKSGTRFAHAWQAELGRQAEAMEGYFEQVVDTLVGAGYRWYETSSFCLEGRQARHNLGYWRGRDYLGIGIGAVSTVAARRWRNRPSLAAYTRSLAAGHAPDRDVEVLAASARMRERLILGLRLDEPVPMEEVAGVVDAEACARLEALGLIERGNGGLLLSRRGRLVGDGVTVALLEEIPANLPDLAAA